MNAITSPAGQPIITPAGRPLWSSAARSFRALLIDSRPHVQADLAGGGARAAHANRVLDLMTQFEMAMRNDDQASTDQFSQEFDAYVNKIGYNPLAFRGFN